MVAIQDSNLLFLWRRNMRFIWQTMIHLAILLVVQQRLYIIKTATHTSKHFNFQQALGHNNLPICVVHFQFDGGGAESRCHIDTTGTILGSYCVLLSASSSFLIGYRDGMTILYNHHKVERWLSGPFTTAAAASSVATTTGTRIMGCICWYWGLLCWDWRCYLRELELEWWFQFLLLHLNKLLGLKRD